MCVLVCAETGGAGRQERGGCGVSAGQERSAAGSRRHCADILRGPGGCHQGDLPAAGQPPAPLSLPLVPSRPACASCTQLPGSHVVCLCGAVPFLALQSGEGKIPAIPEPTPPSVPEDLAVAIKGGKVRAPTHIISTICDDRGTTPPPPFVTTKARPLLAAARRGLLPCGSRGQWATGDLPPFWLPKGILFWIGLPPPAKWPLGVGCA